MCLTDVATRRLVVTGPANGRKIGRQAVYVIASVHDPWFPLSDRIVVVHRCQMRRIEAGQDGREGKSHVSNDGQRMQQSTRSRSTSCALVKWELDILLHTSEEYVITIKSNS